MKNIVGYTMKTLAKSERPRERLLMYGVENLSNIELLAIILRTGNRKETSLELSRKIMSLKENISFLKDISVEELKEINGIGDAKAAEILATIELGKRINLETNFYKKIKSSTDIGNYLVDLMGNYKQEYFNIVLLDTKNNILGVKNISKGSLNSTIVHPREVFKEAVRKSTASLILAHNHPSGDTEPSKEDIGITKKLLDVGNIVGIKVLDHIIIGRNGYFSFKEEGLI